MWTGLKVESLAFKCVFYSTKQNAKGGTECWRSLNAKIKYTTDRAWRVDEKGVIFLVIMFAPGVMVIKISKNASFFVFFADGSKTLVTV